MKELKDALLGGKHTKIMYEEKENAGEAPSKFVISKREVAGVAVKDDLLCEINFQSGSVKENGINGIHNEDLLGIVLCRLEHFQRQKRSEDNEQAIVNLKETLMWLKNRAVSKAIRDSEEIKK